MTLLQLRYALALERTQSFHRAADELRIAQPTLSLQIQKLEREIGYTLFNRDKVPVTIFRNARPFLKQAKQVLRETEKLEYFYSSNSDNLATEIRVGVIPTVASYLIRSFLPALIHSYPQLKIKIYEIPTESIIRQIEEGAIDIGILATPLKLKSIKERPVYYEPFKIYLPPKMEKLKSNMSIEQLADYPVLVLSSDHCFGQQQLRICKGFLQGSVETGSFHTLIQMVDANLGLTLLPEFEEVTNQNRLRSISVPVPAREISLITGPDFYKNAVLKIIQSEIIKIIPKEYHTKKNLSILGVSF